MSRVVERGERGGGEKSMEGREMINGGIIGEGKRIWRGGYGQPEGLQAPVVVENAGGILGVASCFLGLGISLCVGE